MKILLFSVMGDGIGLALQLQGEGHQVVVHFVDENDAKQGQGMLWRSNDWVADARASDLVLFDQNGRGQSADWLRSQGVKVWNGGVIADRLESDRPFGMAVMRKAGIPIPETWDFKNYAEAVEIVNANFKGADRVVTKLNNGAAPSTSYVSRDKKDALSQLEAWETEGQADLGQGGIIQEFIEGIEISVEGWFDGEKFRYPFNYTFEDKKLLNDGLGPAVGCASNATANIRVRHPKLARLLLEPIAPLLKRAGYTGQIDCNSIVSDENGQPYAIEWTPRNGYDATSTIVQTYQGGYGGAIARCLGLEEGDTLVGDSPAKWDMAVAVRVWIPPYPFEPPTKPLGREVYKCIEGVPVNGHLPIESWVPYDVMQTEDGKAICAGTCGVLGIAIAHAKTCDDALREAYKIAERVEAPNASYRTDGCSRVKKQLPVIESLGLLR